MHIFISKLTRKDLTTKDGRAASKFTIITDEGKYYDSWCDDWNKDWKEGDTLNINEAQIQSREYNGKTYLTIKAPNSRAATQNLAVGELKEILNLHTEQLKNLEKMTKAIYDYVIARNAAPRQ